MDELVGVRLLFHQDWHDGPVSGLAKYKGRACFFEAVWDKDADDWTHPRRLLLRSLAPEEAAAEWREHQAFEKYVGTMHCPHVDAADRVQQPESWWSAFYDHAPPANRDRYAHRPVLGSFTE